MRFVAAWSMSTPHGNRQPDLYPRLVPPAQPLSNALSSTTCGHLDDPCRSPPSQPCVRRNSSKLPRPGTGSVGGCASGSCPTQPQGRDTSHASPMTSIAAPFPHFTLRQTRQFTVVLIHELQFLARSMLHRICILVLSLGFYFKPGFLASLMSSWMYI